MFLIKPNILTFPHTIKVFHGAPQSLYYRLWKLIKRTDDRGYSFGNFNCFTSLYKCLVVVLYKKAKRGKTPFGFATVSFNTAYELGSSAPITTSYLDIWIMPKYRCLGFGSRLMKSAVEECVKLTGKKPEGSDKHHGAAWGKRIENELKRVQQLCDINPSRAKDHKKILRLHQRYLLNLNKILFGT